MGGGKGICDAAKRNIKKLNLYENPQNIAGKETISNLGGREREIMEIIEKECNNR